MTSHHALPSLASSRLDCPLCHARLDRSHPDSCPNCDWVAGYRQHQDEIAQAASGRDQAAAFMSIVPGLGHFYKGHVAGGLAAFAGAIAVCLFVAGTVVATVGAAVLLLPIYMIAIALHAYWAEDLAFARITSAAMVKEARPVPEIHRRRQ